MPSFRSSDARRVVLSVDYEVFGNGSGDVRQHILNPTEQMARLCESHGFPLTVFFEVEEYLAFERYRRELTEACGYDPAGLIREQVLALARRGHDIQLHLHPEWHGGRWNGQEWVLRQDQETVDSLFESQGEATSYVASRKRVIDALLEEARTRRRVQVYRAGAFSAQPGRRLLTALAENGIVIDSSVVKGMTRWNGHGALDYRQAPNAKGPWRVTNDVVREDPAGAVWEFPIYSVMGRRWQQATFARFKAKFSRNVPRAQQTRLVRQLGIRRSPFAFLRFLVEPVPIKLDFHNLEPMKLLHLIRSAPKPENGLPDVLVLIGHTKEHIDNHGFGTFLRLLDSESDIKVVGFAEVAEIVKSL
ncbi:MAG: hypothetical protein K9N62_00850 [Verrucomicrobia bacterium]|nr:hypothetical protein [Verrucomicrobiota bacterium]